jgi:hypothetical protein
MVLIREMFLDWNNCKWSDIRKGLKQLLDKEIKGDNSKEYMTDYKVIPTQMLWNCSGKRRCKEEKILMT